MSRIGKQKIIIPSGVTVRFAEGMLTVSGPKGELSRRVHDHVSIAVADGVAMLTVRHPEEKLDKSLWGTWASHLKNMIAGVVTPWQKKLEINGVGYRASVQGTNLKLEVGYTNPVLFALPKDITATVEKNMITLTSADKEQLGLTAAAIREVRKPEPYKGKGIKYDTETIRRKAGKAAKAAGATA